MALPTAMVFTRVEPRADMYTLAVPLSDAGQGDNRVCRRVRVSVVTTMHDPKGLEKVREMYYGRLLCLAFLLALVHPLPR